MKFIAPLIIILLAILAVYLGKVIYDQSFSSPKSSSKMVPTVRSSPTSTSEQTYTFQDENSLLDYISTQKNPTPDQIRNYFQALDRFAKVGEIVTINNCKASPIALKVGLGKEFNILNNDQVEHAIKFPKKLFTLNAGQKLTLLADDLNIGSYAYLCDGQSSGIIFVVNDSN